ncbi:MULTISPECIES: fructose-6-phosphate aldolase [Anaerococcus]|uniref:Probable transaldolase n=4 Tax=Anaerococcus TaxID=165779 RepID=C7HUY3_9FIRM|nr:MULTISPECIES: fructose-6-phosphate aldolase [Anaerococcus]EEU12432.1 fructose-6-phosphate aldolase [Anaerococcus vaginalis ATCC 51170]MBS4889704.1 fructose-6-phosphate aldolase [Anaerococcus vaginalis]MBS6921172.1 fructose-6-phosphate aldolase [Anaerococcus vaginalis]MDD7765667.1 fructose-6-phosphate aldolase [Anaerococcus vaginalis]MDU2375619.1 fructose-6-phosphate aldolase [Anaerococcus vaginalis]
MKFFLDTANIEEIKRVNDLGLCDGVTTNPSIIKKEGRDFEEVVKEICKLVDGPVSAEVTSYECEGMVEQARALSKWAENIVVKIPMTEEGLKAINILSKEKIKTNCTLIFSVSQGLMAMKAGATYISPFMGRIDDMGESGAKLVSELRDVIDIYGYDSQIIAASIRHIGHLEEAALAGAHIATIPGTLFEKLWSHPLTDAGIESFKKDWEAFENR